MSAITAPGTAIAHASQVPDVKRILVPIDHAPGSDVVLDFAAVLACGLHATVAVLHVYEPPNALIAIVPGATVAGEASVEQDAGAALLQHAVDRLHAAGVAIVDRVIERAAPSSDAILAHARAGKFDLLVMGTHGRKGVARLVLGSTAERVLRDAPCPVVTVHLPRD